MVPIAYSKIHDRLPNEIHTADKISTFQSHCLKTAGSRFPTVTDKRLTSTAKDCLNVAATPDTLQRPK